MYASSFGQSEKIDKLIMRLYERVTDEVKKSKNATEAEGMLGLLLAGTE
jgi:hypothetical protein